MKEINQGRMHSSYFYPIYRWRSDQHRPLCSQTRSSEWSSSWRNHGSFYSHHKCSFFSSVAEDHAALLKNYMFGGQIPLQVGEISLASLVGISKWKPWHRNPAAILRRAILALDRGIICSINPQMVTRLQILRNLYFVDDQASHYCWNCNDSIQYSRH